ncbi:ABC-type uncharacterized transport system, periplasmic component [Beggiatoa alba B18LD]|uniref:ABC-type uncharacterized transport system, periplasmic component n=1 Tax=Beggiatoa alba B18LD TaxID=395493 RepID=I3CD90_9GAMM|nr:ABC transporter substrate binding protein [Beggiatoa alba]EIJ41583.1 ABC-type uncharacterized transport system, periplasmic component [Beggiatoa alba B18LD]
MQKTWVKIILFLLFCFPSLTIAESPSPYAGKKILHVASYHEGFEWTDGINRGIETGLKDKGIEYKVFYMDTKRNPTEAWKQAATEKAKAFLEEFKPDVVITSDDDAAKYLIVPNYKDVDLPIVFCGINWDASPYGFPDKNITGMLEVELIPAIIGHLKQHAKGERIGTLTIEGLTERKIVQKYMDILNIPITQSYFAKTFDEWKDSFLKLQSEVDMLIVLNYVGIADWDTQAAIKFVEENTRIPAGASFPWLVPLTLLGITNIPEEQGLWSAQTALKILDGTKPADIPIAQNKDGKLFINMRVADKLGVQFNRSLLKMAEIIR